MTKKNIFKEDITKLFGGATSVLEILKEEIEEKIKDRVEKVIFKLELINKNEFLIIKEMAEKARIENEILTKRINRLEKKIIFAFEFKSFFFIMNSSILIWEKQFILNILIITYINYNLVESNP